MKSIALLLPLVISFNTVALTTQQLLDACKTNGRPCHEIPLANAYVGGALDLLGSLKDTAKLNMQFSCGSTEQLFRVKSILTYIEANQKGFEEQNAMRLVIKYMEETGCAED